MPACFAALGAGHDGLGAVHGLHRAQFCVDEDALPLGTAWLVGLALKSLDELASAAR